MMKHLFIKFPSGRTFLIVDKIEKARNIKRTYILFFNVEALKRNFEIDLQSLNKGCNCFYATPSKIGVKNITKKEGNFYTFLCEKPSIKKFFNDNVFNLINGNDSKDEKAGNGNHSLNVEEKQNDYLILSEEPSGKNKILAIEESFCPVFYLFVLNENFPVAYSPFSYHKVEFKQNEPNQEILSLGNEGDFTIAYLSDNTITVSPNFGELESLYEIDAMDIMINSIMGHLHFKNVTLLKDYNNYSMISEYTRRFLKVKNVSHIFAHTASVMFDNGMIKEKGLGIVYDSISYDIGDQILGGEILYGNIGSYQVVGGWKPVPLPGGDIANIEPWRIALAIIKETLNEDVNDVNLPMITNLRKNPNYSYIFEAINNKNINYSLSSSMHHIVAALGEIIFYEESTFDFDFFENKMDKFFINSCPYEHYPIRIIEEDGRYLIDTYDLFKRIISDLLLKTDPSNLICNALVSIAAATGLLIEKLSKVYNEKKIILSGEFFKHPHFLSLIHQELINKGFEVYIPRNIPVDDSGISVGQIIYKYFE